MGLTYASMTVVEARSYSRQMGATSLEMDTITSGIAARRASAICRSWLPLTYANRKLTATAAPGDSSSRLRTRPTTRSTSSPVSAVRTVPSDSIRSRTPNVSWRAAYGTALTHCRSYSPLRSIRWMYRLSSKPAVVTNRVLAPERWMTALVAIVVPSAK